MLREFLQAMDIREFVAWYYSPMAINYTSSLAPLITVYDCMDELSAFKFAPPTLKERESMLLTQADLVFTGGNNLFQMKKHLHKNIHAFPSSIDKDHFAAARKQLIEPNDQENIPHPRLGFYGVLDERLDISLIGEIAELRPDWQIVLVGPVVKIDPVSLPRAENIHYLGAKTYSELPAYLSGWDIAIMPFALNESTKYISPTKTPEYLAGGKPVISTPIADVVNDYGNSGLVTICQTANEFVEQADNILISRKTDSWISMVDQHLSKNSWDATWSKMAALIEEAINNKRSQNENFLQTCSITL